jgi:hypothetical protein
VQQLPSLSAEFNNDRAMFRARKLEYRDLMQVNVATVT